jgi:[protein-PII] uridylyltransferase
LLASIGLLFAELDIDLIDARIATLGERVEDVFTIRDSGVADAERGSQERIYLLENAIRQRIDNEIAREL